MNKIILNLWAVLCVVFNGFCFYTIRNIIVYGEITYKIWNKILLWPEWIMATAMFITSIFVTWGILFGNKELIFIQRKIEYVYCKKPKSNFKFYSK
jgi:hypothetical protein